MVTMRLKADGLEAVELALDRFRQNMTDARPTMERMAVWVRTVVFAETFEKRGPGGATWAPLSPRYADWKARVRPGAPIMVFDGDLRRSMTSRRGGVFEVSATGFEVGTDVPYARYHQDGGPNLPRRPLIGDLTQGQKRELVKMLQRDIVEGVAQ